MFRRNRLPRGTVLLEDPDKRSKFSLRFWFFGLIVLIFVTLIFAEIATANDLHSLSDVESGQLVFKNDSGTYTRAVHLDTDVKVNINGMIAKVEYVQRFKNTSTQWQEAVYVFPLGEQAAVNFMEMIIGERRIRSEIKEREEAKRIYEQAKTNGQRAALTEQQRPNLFTQKVANIGPGEEVSVAFHFVQQLGYEAGIFSFHLPTTLTPRFIPGTSIASEDEKKHFRNSPSGWGIPTDEVPDADKITPYMQHVVESQESETEAPPALVNPISISVMLNAGLRIDSIKSPYHDIQETRIGERYQVELADRQVSMDRDFRLSWMPIVSASQMPEAAIFSEIIDDENYLLLMLLPPQVENTERRLPREMIFVIDTSGSMQGTSIVQARNSLAMALERLQPSDRFNVIEFNSTHQSLFSSPVEANPRNLDRAKHFVRNLHANGGTNMQPALADALVGYPPENYLKQVIFITDGAVGNETALFSLIENQLGDARLFTVGIGSAPNSYFMRKAAQFGRGSFSYIGKQSEVQEKMTVLFRKLESPVLSDLEIHWPDRVEQYPSRTPDLYIGSPLILAAKTSALDGSIRIKGSTAGQEWSRTIELKTHSENSGSGVGTVWGRAKIESLMDEKVRGRSEAEVKADVVSVALAHHLISSYTSLVAVEEVVARPVAEESGTDNLQTSPIPNAVPNGQLQQHGTYPQTATWAPFNLLFGSLCLALWVLLRKRRLI